jgi:hypothetical protein
MPKTEPTGHDLTRWDMFDELEVGLILLGLTQLGNIPVPPVRKAVAQLVVQGCQRLELDEDEEGAVWLATMQRVYDLR